MAHPVILVEDDPDLRDELEIALRTAGFDVHCAANGRDGLYLLARIGDRPVVVLDLMLPGMSGWEALDWMQRLGRTAPVIAISAVAGATHPPGAVAFLPKPLRLDELLPLVHKHAN